MSAMARREYMRRRFRESATCPGCGKPVWGHHIGYGAHKGRCRECFNEERTESVRADALRCSSCRSWLPDEAFPRSSAAKRRRGRHAECKPCAAARRRAERARKREQAAA